MKIAVDARMLKMSGIGTYLQNLIQNDCYNIVLGNKEDLKEYEAHFQNDIEFNTKIYGIKEQLKFPYKELKKLKPDILHVPHYNIPIFYRGKMVVTIHDLTHLVLPEFLPSKFAKIYAKFMIGLAAKKASKVITVSENTKNDILKMFKVKPEKIDVIYNGVSQDFKIKPKEETEYLYQKYNIPRDKKILMYVGNLKPHKNLERLLEAYSKLDDIEKTCLLLVGKAFENYNLEIKEKQLNIENKVIRTGIIEKEELIDLYNIADLFVFPSLYEGFGLPVLEALACGTPVACSNSSSIPEVGGEFTKYFNPYDVEEMSNTISYELKNNSKENINYPEIENWLKHFNWQDGSNKIKEIFNKL